MLAAALARPLSSTIRRSYARFPNIKIEALQIDEKEPNTKRMIDVMAVSTNGSMPLYLHIVNCILRDLRLEQQQTSSAFNFRAFRRMLDAEGLTITSFISQSRKKGE
ncbi:hypothetical protein K504DRAFT_505350 [Pleomassaria siparia CBS 279.74]|uniref:Uncharacterized protein n=1 Tax=Pleomassaria siparia CBS 279.74 TaxID=1314801 RepID=A0A6G1K0N0_9PLEO|nr:hypothetical protein K504DRAFT_505350 [Pleomassaria siparia CBS 279.74]